MSNNKILEHALSELCAAIEGHALDVPRSVMSSYIQEHMEKSKSLNELSSALYNCMMIERERPSKSDWISVDDDLPDDKEIVIVFGEELGSCERFQRMAMYSENSGKWFTPEFFELSNEFNVTHWKHMDENPE